MYLEKMIGKTMADIVKKSGINCVVLLTKNENTITCKIVKNRRIVKEKFEVEPMPSGSINQIRMIIKNLVEYKLLKEGDRVICLVDESLGIGFEGLFLFFTIDRKFLELTTLELKKEVKKSVFEAVLEIAREIAKEGREGKKIGTGFVIGDYENVSKRIKQLVLNPFEGHRVNVTDPALKETIKEFSQLDGVFVIDEKGFVRSAGSYINVNTRNINLPGLGSRHLACAAITKYTSAVAVCVSESGGTIRVFRNGNIVMEEKP